ncbi:ComEC/Rec2 family competence protein [Actinomadura livida]|uniref:ComEC/Rec2 family competence protein n=1 Tax=Actinomadura livida TaxID=79909 RepID=A0A7W7MZ76_9ACTN|nr:MULTISPECIES: ComEC/Rec2 family competence protein [Actinomadura]MBB4776691.1 competence protein ComEC [Actinomadura catellatispora]GGT94153.1 competence protein ComEC [Actinomadura livida]
MTDLRLLAPALATWLTAATTIALPPPLTYTIAATTTLTALYLLTPRHPKTTHQKSRGTTRRPETGARRRLVGVVLVCAAASAAGVGLRATAVGTGPVRDLARDGRFATAEAVVTGDPRAKPGNGRKMIILRARAEVVPRAEVRVPVLLIADDARWLRMVPSQRVRLHGRFVPPEGADLLAAVVIVRGPPTVLGPPSRMQRAAEHVRARLRAAVARLPPDQRGVLPGMVVGDTSGLDLALAEDFRTAGLTHLMVVSGANLAIVIGAVLGLCRLLGLGRRRAPPVAVVAVLAFVLVARPEPSVLRATVMGLIGLLALVTGRQRQGIPALAAAVLLLVLVDPALARSYGFTLSVLATAGLLVLAPRWRERLARRLPGPLADALAVAAAAQVAVSPVLVMLSGEIGVVAVFANLLAAPAVAPATLLGALAAITALISVPLAQGIVWPAGLAVGWIIRVARTAAALPYATIPWTGGGLGAMTLLLAAGLALLILRSRRLRLLAAAAMIGIMAAVIAMRVTSPGWPPPGWQMVACDVGQGDALVLYTAPAQAVVVDTGPDPALVDRCLRRLDVKDVPLIVLTHPHADHINGTSGVRNGRRVHAILTTSRTSGREARLAPDLHTHRAEAGQQWRIGDLTLSVLAPRTGPALTPGDDGTTINNASVVVVARSPGFSALLAGDIEEEAQRALTATVPHVQVLKVPHHGARGQAPGFLAAARSSISLISVGEDNDYGHPSPATLKLLQRLGTQIHRTDQEGDIAITRTKTGIAVVPSH